jgi:hypothetical protein
MIHGKIRLGADQRWIKGGSPAPKSQKEQQLAASVIGSRADQGRFMIHDPLCPIPRRGQRIRSRIRTWFKRRHRPCDHFTRQGRKAPAVLRAREHARAASGGLVGYVGSSRGEKPPAGCCGGGGRQLQSGQTRSADAARPSAHFAPTVEPPPPRRLLRSQVTQMLHLTAPCQILDLSFGRAL